jgi:uncharacterized repeat protein (TIGR01451 family)
MRINQKRFVQLLLCSFGMTALLVLPSWPLSAAGVWYVAPTGSDTYTCQSAAAPCATINGVLSKPSFAAGDTVRVASGTYTGTGWEVVAITKDTELLGGWNSNFTEQIGTSTVDAEGVRGGININGAIVTIDHFTVQNATLSGINVETGILTLSYSNIVNNSSWWLGSGGGIYGGGGAVHIRNSTITGNSSNFDGGGLALFSGGTINNSTITDNISNDNPCCSGFGGGGVLTYGALFIGNSTITGNKSSSAFFPGGVYGSITVSNSIITGNSNISGASDCGGTVVSSGYNIVGNMAGCNFTANIGDLLNVDPKLAALRDNGGGTLTQALLQDSPAFSAGNPAGCRDSLGNILSVDQRGKPRLGRCDIGAFETQPLEFSSLTTNMPTAAPGSIVALTVTLKNVATTAFPTVRVTDTLPSTLTYVPNSLTATAGSSNFSNGVITWNGSLGNGASVAISFAALAGPALGNIADSALIDAGTGITTVTASIEANPFLSVSKYPSNPVLGTGAVGSWDSAGVLAPTVLKDGGSYRLWYTGIDHLGNRAIGYAISPDGIHWTKYSENPVLHPTQSWETNGVSAPTVAFEGGIYKMWYSGRDNNGITRIGYATSPDSIHWTAYADNPVLNIGSPDLYDDGYVHDPTVLKIAGLYHMWFEAFDGGTSRIGHATSPDGVHWTTKYPNPAVDIGTPGTWDWVKVYSPSIAQANGRYFLWYAGTTLPAARQLGYATSADGSTWAKRGKVVLKGAAGAFDAAAADYPTAMVEDNQFKIWYSGLNGEGVYTIGYATATPSGTVLANSPSFLYMPIISKPAATPTCTYYTESFGDPTSGWPTSEDANRKLAYVGGEYQIYSKNANQGWSVTPGANASDFRVSVTARHNSSVGGSYGVLFGINDDWSEFYEFEIGTNSYRLYRFDSNFWYPIKLWTTSAAILPDLNANRIQVVRTGAMISLYANSQLLATLTDSTYIGTRRIGLVVNSGSSPLDVRFDDFSLAPPDCAAGAGSQIRAAQFIRPEVRRIPVPPNQ